MAATQSTLWHFDAEAGAKPMSLKTLGVADAYQGFVRAVPSTKPYSNIIDAYQESHGHRVFFDGDEYCLVYTPQILARLIDDSGDKITVMLTRAPEATIPPESDPLVKDLLNTNQDNITFHFAPENDVQGRLTAHIGSNSYTRTVNYTRQPLIDATPSWARDGAVYASASGKLQDWYEYLQDADDDGWVNAEITSANVQTNGIIRRKTVLKDITTRKYSNFNIGFKFDDLQLDGQSEEDFIGQTIRIRSKGFSEQYREDTGGSTYHNSPRHAWQLHNKPL